MSKNRRNREMRGAAVNPITAAVNATTEQELKDELTPAAPAEVVDAVVEPVEAPVVIEEVQLVDVEVPSTFGRGQTTTTITMDAAALQEIPVDEQVSGHEILLKESVERLAENPERMAAVQETIFNTVKSIALEDPMVQAALKKALPAGYSENIELPAIDATAEGLEELILEHPPVNQEAGNPHNLSAEDVSLANDPMAFMTELSEQVGQQALDQMERDAVSVSSIQEVQLTSDDVAELTQVNETLKAMPKVMADIPPEASAEPELPIEVPAVDEVSEERDTRPASRWTPHELYAWCAGKIQPGKMCTEQTLVNALRNLTQDIDDRWPVSDIKAFMLTDELPPKASTGVYVRDVLRDAKPALGWSKDDLVAWARGEVKLPASITNEQAMRALRMTLNVSHLWNDAQVIAFAVDGSTPEKTDEGVLVDDPKRADKIAAAWTDAEIKGWLKGKLVASPAAPAAALEAEARRRFEHPDAWTLVDIQCFAIDGTVPKTTESGLWLRDETRNRKDPMQWTLQELQAWAKGEIKSGPQISDKQLQLAARTYVTTHQDSNGAEWSDREIHAWLKTGETPKKTTGGFYPNSPVRALRNAGEWKREELTDYLRKEIPATKNATYEDLHYAICAKWECPITWTEADVIAFVLKNIQPKMTSNGLYVNDQARQYKPAVYWKQSELKAWGLGELPASDVARDEDLRLEVCKRFSYPDRLDLATVKKHIATLKEEERPMSNVIIKQNLDEYLKGMGPGKRVSEADAAGYQTLMYNTLVRVLAMRGREFTDSWGEVLDFFNINLKSMFDAGRAFRGIGQLNLSSRDRKNFEQLMNLLIKTASPATRYQQAKNTSFETVLRDMPSEEIRQQLLAFYNLHN